MKIGNIRKLERALGNRRINMLRRSDTGLGILSSTGYNYSSQSQRPRRMVPISYMQKEEIGENQKHLVSAGTIALFQWV